MIKLKKGQIVWVKLDGIGSEQSGTRPCVIVQNNTGNRFSPTTIVIPLTTRRPKRLLPTHLVICGELLGENLKDSVLLCEQIKIIDKSRITYVGKTLPANILEEIDLKLLISLGIKEIVS